MIYIENIRFGGPSRKMDVFYNFTDITKFMILFHLQRPAAEGHKLIFLNY